MGTQDITLKNDPRVLPIGKFLRKSKLNEVPQLWDVFVGTISLVGWRPLMPKGFADYPKWVQEKIVNVKPGLTGIGSLVFRDEEAIIARAQEEGRDLRQCYREDIMPFKGELESWYVDHASLWTDLKIVLATAIAVLRPQWRGFWGWFDRIPKPTSPILKAVLRVDVG
jgi:lipopolysaccharide/colanic/teichoic acid biosynthesis glycosyltransferase